MAGEEGEGRRRPSVDFVSTGSGRTEGSGDAEGRSSTSAEGPKPVLSDGAGGFEGPGTNEAGGAADQDAAEPVKPPSGDAFVVRPGKHRDMQVVRVGKRKLFDRKRRKVFLEWFAATGNCVFAAAKAGVHYKTVWKHRVKDAGFREAFDVAMEQGTVRAKARLMEDKASAPIEVDGDLDSIELVPPDPAFVLDLVARFEARKAGAAPARQKGRTPRTASNEEVEKALAKRLALFARRQRAMGRSSAGGPAAGEEQGSGSSGDPAGSAPVTPPPGFTWSCSGEDCPQQSSALPGEGRTEHSPSSDGEE